MKPAAFPGPRTARLLAYEGGHWRLASVEDLPQFSRPHDLWVVNDAATFPASLQGTTANGKSIEIRLFPPEDGVPETRVWTGVLFGRGNWRTRTEERPPPPFLRRGETLRFSEGLCARVLEIDSKASRLLRLQFNLEDQEFWPALYRAGKPVQYAYLREELRLWSVQTAFAARPWAAEMPSAARPFRMDLILRLREQGAEVHALTHATGLSSTGDSMLDSRLPFPESFEIPQTTVDAIARAKNRGGRVIAVGTSVLRALEGSASSPTGLRAGKGCTDLVVGPGYHRKIVDGILSGIHIPGETHFELLRCFIPAERLTEGTSLADQAGFTSHEFGESTLILPASPTDAA